MQIPAPRRSALPAPISTLGSPPPSSSTNPLRSATSVASRRSDGCSMRASAGRARRTRSSASWRMFATTCASRQRQRFTCCSHSTASAPWKIRVAGDRGDHRRPAPRRSACGRAAVARDVRHVAGRDELHCKCRSRPAARTALRLLRVSWSLTNGRLVISYVELRGLYSVRARLGISVALGARARRRGALGIDGTQIRYCIRRRLRARGRVVRGALCGDDAVRSRRRWDVSSLALPLGTLLLAALVAAAVPAWRAGTRRSGHRAPQ